MSFLLDTDTCISIIRNVPRVSSRFAQAAGTAHLSVVTITELEMWLLRPKTSFRHTQGCFTLLGQVSLIEVTEPIAHRAAMIGSGMQARQQKAALADLLIAATALERGLTLVTHGAQQFAAIQGLTTIDWNVP